MENRTKALLVTAVIACGSASAPADPSALTQPLAQNVTITEIAMLQALKVPIMQGGNAADHSNIPLVALRDSVLRVYLQPGNDFTAHKLTARARIVTPSPFGSTAQVFSVAAVVSGQSQESDLTSTLDIPIPGVALERGSSVTVVVNDAQGDPPDSTSSYAKWPQDGSLADLGTVEGGTRLRVMVVPVQYNADGSGRVPDTSDAQMQLYTQRFFQLYPVAAVEMTVHDPWPWGGFIDAGGNGMFSLLQALGTLRNADQPDPDVYYYAAFEPTADFGSFCGGGCVTGLSTLGAPHSVGIGYSGPATPDTAAHEVGHAHNLNHAPGCGAAGPYIDPDTGAAYPYPTGLIGVWGYDALAPAMVDPSTTFDIMSYCGPKKWISDFHYSELFRRVKTDNGFYNDWMSGSSGAGQRFAMAPVEVNGDVHVSTSATREPWVLTGQPREATWSGGHATTYWFPNDHLPGGFLYVPDAVPAMARVSALRASEPATMLVR